PGGSPPGPGIPDSHGSAPPGGRRTKRSESGGGPAWVRLLNCCKWAALYRVASTRRSGFSRDPLLRGNISRSAPDRSSLRRTVASIAVTGPAKPDPPPHRNSPPYHAKLFWGCDYASEYPRQLLGKL